MTAVVEVPCVTCQRLQNIPVSGSVSVWTAWITPCGSCGDTDWDGVDEVAVRRLCTGEPPVRATTAEKFAAVRALTGRCLSAAQIAELMNVSSRTVERLRARAAS